jgi:hypothetical protein
LAYDGVRNRNFTLLGDPSLKLAIPEGDIVVESVKTAFRGETDTLSALDRIEISGFVGKDSLIDQAFNGTLQFRLFDKPTRKTTFQQSGENAPFSYLENDNYLVVGKVKVTDGTFTLNFQLPKDMNYQFGEGMLQFYASDIDTDYDAKGTIPVTVGGSSPTQATVMDNTPPEIELMMADEKWTTNDLLPRDTHIIVKLKDESGINISSSGLSRGINIVLNKGTDDELVLSGNGFYESDLGTTKSGIVRIPIYNLASGNHTVEVSASDLYNNRNAASITFRVGKSDEGTPTIFQSETYPNPTFDISTLSIAHNSAGRNIAVEYQVFDINGTMLNQNRVNISNAPYRVEVPIDISLVKQGIYFVRYKIVLNNIPSQIGAIRVVKQ